MQKVVPMNTHSKAPDARRAMIAKIHIAKNQLALEDDSYRALLKKITGKESSADLTLAQLEAVLLEFKRLGFAGAKPRRKRGGLPDDNQAKKIRALWLNLYHLGELRDPAESALVAYCRRMSGVQAIEWMHAEQFDNVIRGLNGWLERIGWHKPDTATVKAIMKQRVELGVDTYPGAINYYGVAAKVITIRLQCALLNKTADSPELMPAPDMDALIEQLGVKCRALKTEQEDA